MRVRQTLVVRCIEMHPSNMLQLNLSLFLIVSTTQDQPVWPYGIFRIIHDMQITKLKWCMVAKDRYPDVLARTVEYIL